MRWLLNGAIGAVLVLILVAVVRSQQPTPGGDPIIDGWPIGPVLSCDNDTVRCDELVPAGLAGFDQRDPGHAPVASSELHAEGLFSDALTGERFLLNRSGGNPSVLVMKLSNGSTRAIGVGYDLLTDAPVAVPEDHRP
ncbi:MAG TPA: hypothetical protein VFI28_01675 [Candidatus Limnocylindrales bacterium]|nr:hypothetical protein [Candidatus Limnocylindrales bacterium]